jgi:hypothetical protein
VAEKIDDLTINYFQDEVQVVKEVEKNVLTRGSWTTIMYLYQELDKNTNDFGQQKVSIRRYQKRSGVYKQQSKFNISSAKQGRQISEILLNWFQADDSADSADAGEDAEQMAQA